MHVRESEATLRSQTSRKVVVLAAALVAVATTVPGRARATPPAQVAPQQGQLLGLVSADTHGVVVAREALVARFDGRGRGRVELRYDLRNPSAERVTLVAAFVVAGLPATRVTVEREPSAARPLSEAERGEIESSLEGHGLAAMVAEHGLFWRGIELSLDAGATRTVVVSSEVLTEQIVDPVQLFIPAIRERHLALGPDEDPYRAERVHVPTASILLWGAERELVAEVHAPTGFSVATSLGHGGAGAHGGGVDHARGAPPAEVVVSATHVDRFPVISFGGPYIGIGGAVGHGFRMRAGVELGLGRYLIASANVDTSFDATWVLAPVLEAATPLIVIIPSVAAGVGPAFRFEGGDFRAGVRIQGTIHWLLGLVVCVDVYPAAQAAGGFAETTLLGTVGL